MFICLYRRNQARAQETEMYAKANEARKAESSTGAVAAHAPVCLPCLSSLLRAMSHLIKEVD